MKRVKKGITDTLHPLILSLRKTHTHSHRFTVADEAPNMASRFFFAFFLP